MSDQENENGNELPQVSELDSLKARADLMNIKYHPLIGVDSLRARITAKLNGEPDVEATKAAPVQEEESENAKRLRLKKEANKLVRVNINCNNPAKKEWDGEIFTTGNLLVGTFRKYVPFGTTDGYHVPQIILNMIKTRECQIFVSKKTKMGQVREGKLIKEFTIEIMDPLTQDEITELARRQAMAAGQTV